MAAQDHFRISLSRLTPSERQGYYYYSGRQQNS